MSKVSDRIRSEFGAGDAIRDAGLTTPEDITRYDNIVYGEQDHWQMLDVYRPKPAGNTKLPVIISVHGGGWVYGDKAVYQFYCMNLAQRGFAVVNFTYRLAPEYKFPAPLEDTNKVFSWVLAHTDLYGFDANNIFAVGDSAGANTLALYCAICANPDYARRFHFHPPENFIPSAVALNCGIYEIVPEDQGHMGLVAEYLPQHGVPEELDAINAVTHITNRFPPVFLMTSTGDFLKRQAIPMAQRLIDCDVPLLFRFFGDMEHKPGHVFHCNIRSDTAKQCNDAECAFFREYLQ